MSKLQDKHQHYSRQWTAPACRILLKKKKWCSKVDQIMTTYQNIPSPVKQSKHICIVSCHPKCNTTSDTVWSLDNEKHKWSQNTSRLDVFDRGATIYTFSPYKRNNGSRKRRSSDHRRKIQGGYKRTSTIRSAFLLVLNYRHMRSSDKMITGSHII